MNSLTKSAVVTGAGNGIGKAIALELGRRSYRVCVVDIDKNEAQGAAREIEAAGGAAQAFLCDVTQKPAIRNLVDECVAASGPPDLVFSNAGAGVRKKIAEFTREDLDWIFSLNVFGMVDVAAQFGEAAIAAGKDCHVVVTGSEHSVGFPHGGNAAYTATKHAILAFAEGLRHEWKDQTASVGILCPGLTQSRFWEGQRHRPNAPTPEPGAAAVMQRGMPAEQLAKIAVDGAEDQLFYIFTHPHVEQYTEHRFAEIKDAFEILRNKATDLKNYDVDSVVKEMLADRN